VSELFGIRNYQTDLLVGAENIKTGKPPKLRGGKTSCHNPEEAGPKILARLASVFKRRTFTFRKVASPCDG
jgi:hypothetical protein